MAIVANHAITLNSELTRPVSVEYIDGNVFSQDNAGNTVHVYIYYNGQPQEVVGSVSANVIRADGSTVAVSGAMEGNRAYVIFPQAVYAVPGVISVVVKVTENTTVTTIAAFVANVYRSSTDTVVDPGQIIPSVQNLIAAIDAAINSIPADYSALLLMLAKNYSPSKTYIVGEYAWEAGVLKRCIVPITAGETYTAAHWTDACLGDDLTALKSAFDFDMLNLNCENLIDLIEKSNRSAHSVDWTWNGNKLTAYGTASALENYTVFSSQTTFPTGFAAGKTYRVLHQTSKVVTKVYDYTGGSTVELFNSKDPGTFTIPANCAGIIIRFTVANGVSADETFVPCIIGTATETNAKLTETLNNIYPLRGYPEGYSSCNDIVNYGIYFIRENEPINLWAFDNVAGWLFVVPMNDSVPNSNIAQIALRYSPFAKRDSCVYRVKRNGTWTEWLSIHETFELGEIINAVLQKNAIDIVGWTTGTTGTNNGVTYTKNSNSSWTIDGETGSNASVRNIMDYHEELPDSIVPGRKYKVSLTHESTAYIQVYFYYSDSTSSNVDLDKEDSFVVPANAVGIIIRFRVAKNTTVDNETVSLSIVAVPEWQQTVVNQTVYNDTINNDYDISVSPQITTDTNGWLQPVDTESEDETGKTDMTSAIMAMLTETGYCHLAPGIYYVSGSIDMPEGSMIEGCGYDTDVRLLSSVQNGYVFKMEKYNSIKNLKVSGSYSPLPYGNFTADRGTRNGIIFNSQYAAGTSETEFCTINNVYVLNFTGCGIKCFNTSIATQRGLYASQIDIKRCQTAIFVDYYSEFNKFVQVNTRYCYIGCENDGGNNMFIGCTFHATNTGFIIDNSLSDKANNAHGSAVGCTFCHVGSNSGTGIAVKNTTNGFTFSDCQVWYCSILIEDSYGITFSNIEFGRGVPIGGQSAKGATITINRGGTVMFTGCVFMNDSTYPPTITVTDNSKVKFTGCYGSHSGNAITVT